MEQNYAFQSYLNLFNYKTYSSDKHKYFTANVISVWEKYYPIYGNKSQSETLNMWLEIYLKWCVAFGKKYNRSFIEKKGTITHYFKDPWNFIFRHHLYAGGLEKNYHFVYSLVNIYGRGNDDTTARDAYTSLKDLYNNYLSFVHYMNAKIKDMEHPIIESVASKPVNYSWVESLGRFDIKKYDPKKDRKGYYRGIYKVHPALLNLDF